MTRRPRLLPALLVLALLALTAMFAAIHPFDDDEFQHAHYAWLLHHGQRPFADFFEHHLPTYHLLVAPAYAACESPASLFVLRFLSWACLVATLACAYATSRRFCKGDGGPVAAALLLSASPVFVAKMVEARPEAPAVLCYAAALHLLFNRRADRAAHAVARIALGGFLAGAVPALSHKFALPAAALLVGAFLLHGARRGLVFLAASAMPLLAVLAWAAGQGIMDDLYRDVFALSVGWKNRFSPAGYLATLWCESSLLVATGVAGLVLLAAGSVRACRESAVLSLALAASTATLFLVPEPYRQSFLPLFPLLAIGAAVTADRAFAAVSGGTADSDASTAARRLPGDGLTPDAPCRPPVPGARTGRVPGAAAAWFLLAVAAIYPGACGFATDLKLSPAADLRRMRAADATGSPRFFDGRGLVFYRAHTGRHACMHQGILAMLDPAHFAAETVAALRAGGFPTVILDYRVLQMPPEVVGFIRDHYLPLADDVFVPGFRIDRSRLAGRPCRVQVPVAGQYRVAWRGGKVLCDGQELTAGKAVALTAGEHTLKGVGFVEGFTAVLESRATAKAGATP